MIRHHYPTRRKTESLSLIDKLVSRIQKQCQILANPSKVKPMQSYVKTSMPMYGINKPALIKLVKEIQEDADYGVITKRTRTALITQEKEKKATSTTDKNDNQNNKDNNNNNTAAPMFREFIRTIWELPHREEKYIAIDLATHCKDGHTHQNLLDIFEQMLREDFMWWDLCDPIAINLVGSVLSREPDETKRTLRRWIRDDTSLWIRRTALLAQLKHKDHTDEDMLFEFCYMRRHETEFFIRKAIGWALRQHSRTNPEAVKDFLEEHKSDLSGLSYREGAKYLVKTGKM